MVCIVWLEVVGCIVVVVFCVVTILMSILLPMFGDGTVVTVNKLYFLSNLDLNAT